MPNLANYTTEVAALKSVGEIQGMLVAHKAKSILIDYDGDGQPSALAFIVPTPRGDVPFHLPANVSRVEAILVRQRVKKPQTWQSDYKEVMGRIHEKAGKVAWRIIKDWVRAQMAIIDTEMVTLEQVMLPYMEIRDGRTLYEGMVEKGFYLPEGKGE